MVSIGRNRNRHERPDVVAYRQNVFLPAFAEIKGRLHDWTQPLLTDGGIRYTVVWCHDETTFYANDHCRSGWKHKSEKAVPLPKGEGASQMAADFASADYGWL